MKSEFDKILEEVIKKGMESKILDSPSSNFTKELLNKSLFQPMPEQPPLIRRSVWIFIASIIATIVVLGLIIELAVEPVHVLNSLSKIGIPEWNLVQIPDTLIYIICIAAAFVLIQVSWLKKYFQSRINMS